MEDTIDELKRMLLRLFIQIMIEPQLDKAIYAGVSVRCFNNGGQR